MLQTQNSFICSAEAEYDEMKKLSLPCSRCHIDLGFVKPTFLIRDADLNLRIAGLPTFGPDVGSRETELRRPTCYLVQVITEPQRHGGDSR